MRQHASVSGKEMTLKRNLFLNENINIIIAYAVALKTLWQNGKSAHCFQISSAADTSKCV